MEPRQHGEDYSRSFGSKGLTGVILPAVDVAIIVSTSIIGNCIRAYCIIYFLRKV
jgi:hypothetical protein